MDPVERLAAALQRDFPVVPPSTDRAWSRPVPARVVDCVLSLNRRYDGFVVPRLDNFEHRFPDLQTLHELRELIDSYPSPAAFVADALNYRDAGRAQVLSDVATFLLRAVELLPGASELERLQRWAQAAEPSDHRKAGIRGFGLAGFQYLRMLFGASTTKPDVHIRRYVAEVVGHPVSDLEALTLLEQAAAKSGTALRDVDTAIWERSARQTSLSPPART